MKETVEGQKERTETKTKKERQRERKKERRAAAIAAGNYPGNHRCPGANKLSILRQAAGVHLAIGLLLMFLLLVCPACMDPLCRKSTGATRPTDPQPNHPFTRIRRDFGILLSFKATGVFFLMLAGTNLQVGVKMDTKRKTEIFGDLQVGVNGHQGENRHSGDGSLYSDTNVPPPNAKPGLCGTPGGSRPRPHPRPNVRRGPPQGRRGGGCGTWLRIFSGETAGCGKPGDFFGEHVAFHLPLRCPAGEL